MSGRSDYLKELIQNGLTGTAVEVVRNPDDYHEGESFVFAVLGAEKSAPALVEAVLEAFVATRENRYRKHGGWVHSLSHFTKNLWQHQMYEWIKRFNEVAFEGANELRDSNCSDRLVHDFGQYAPFNFNPADFHLTMENLRWMEWNKYFVYEKARIEHGPFESADDLKRCEMLCEIRNQGTFEKHDMDSQCDLIDIEAIQPRIEQLQALGVDTSEFVGLGRRLLEAKLAELETTLAEISDKNWKEDIKEWNRERTRKGIKATQAMLATTPV